MTRPIRCPVLVERDEELRTLSRLASDTSAYGARVVVLTGEAGAGKSRLAQDFASSLPEQWSARTVRFTRTAASLPRLAPDRPLAVVLDDAHFLDPSAIGDLPALLDELAADPVLLVMTFRLGFHRAGSAEMGALAELVRDPRALELRVLPLSAEGVAEMAAAMGRYASEELYRRTGGNAFWAEELLREDERIPWTVVESVAAQLESLPAEARELACALAVAEETLSAGVARELVDDVDVAWGALVDQGLAEADAGGIRLRHALVGEAIVSRLGPVESARVHSLLAPALAGEGADAERVARHWAAAGETRRAAALARELAPRLREAGAIRRAYRCYEVALEHPPQDPRAAAELHEEGALTAARIGEYETMSTWLERAEHGYRDAGLPDRAIRMVLDPTFDYLPVRRSERVREEPVERLLLETREAVGDNDPTTARALIDTAIGVARSRRDGMALARTARMLALTLGEFERADGLLGEALDYPDVAAHPGRQSRVLTIRANSLATQGYTHASLDVVQRAVAITRRESEAVYRVGEIALANALLLIGRTAEAVALLTQAGEAMPGAAAIAQTAGGVRAFEAGDQSGLDVIASATDRLIAGLDFDPIGLAIVGGHVLGMRALAEAHGGRAADALRTVARIDALAPEPFNDVVADVAYALARSGAALGDGRAPREATRRIAELARLASGPAVIGAVEAVRGWVASSGDRGEHSARHFQAAAEHFERAPRWILAAEAWCDAAEAAGPGAGATSALGRAQRICEELELTRVRARLELIRDRLAHERAHVPADLAHLTPREREVVLLAADGLSNREIGARLYLSSGTVRNYLSTAFGKLGVTRRAELGRRIGPAGIAR